MVRTSVRRRFLWVGFAASMLAIPTATEPSTNASTATLELKNLTPPPGSIVDRTVVIVAELEYTIADFRDNTFEINVQFDTTSPHTTRSAPGPLRRESRVKKSSGTITLKQPLREVWDETAIARPFKVWFYLTRKQGGGRSVSVATVGPIEYKEQ